MERLSRTPIKRAAWINAIASACAFFIALLLYRESMLAPATAAQKGLRNVDFGVYEAIAANYYFMPISLALAAAAIALFRGWRGRRVLHWFAWLLVAVPLGYLVASEVMLRVAA